MRAQRFSQRSRIHLLQAGSVLLVAVILLTQPLLVGRVHTFIEMVGVTLAIVCIAGRLWSCLYIGSRKNRELVTTGPYSITRNPLYFFSTVGAVGVGLMFSSITAALVLGFVIYRALIATANKEREHLRAIFGAPYEVYERQTPLFWPKPTLYRDTQEVTFSPKALKRTFLDGMLFVLVFPVIEMIEHLHSNGLIPILMRVF
jgi:protein-S-isoprenylcysteine O-methyltransferase Ste14